jgi:DNA-binding NtrC family response regulator
VLTARDVITAADLPFVRQGLRDPATPMGLGARSSPRPRDGAGDGDLVRSLGPELAELPYGEAKRRLVTLFDETYTAEILRQSGGNLSEAARRAGLDRSNFRRLLKRRKDEP